MPLHNKFLISKKKQAILGSIFVFVGILGVVLVWYVNSRYPTVTRPFSSYTFLQASWENYKLDFINDDGRVLDKSQDNITTSEGQSYAMLRSVWIDDKQSFDRVWKFTKENLKRPNDNLFGWKWGETQENTFGFLGEGADNSASDADSDIALALIFASRRWGDSRYLDEAKTILADLWEINTAEVKGKRYLLAGNWAEQPTELVLNPSYFSPYAWRIFAEVDKEHDWESLISPSYELLEKVSNSQLDKSTSVGLPPDWVSVSKSDGEIKAPDITTLTTNYSFDAIRVPWRIAIDYQWNNEQRALNYLKENFDHLEQEYKNSGKLVASFSHSGERLTEHESPAMYAMSLAYFMHSDKEIAGKIYQEKIIDLYSNRINSFEKTLGYYDQNLLWFAAALYNGRIIKL